jgi:hypothetical protein
MSWVRKNLRIGTWCALFALAVQLLVLFGHVHCAWNVCTPPSQASVGTLAGGLPDGAGFTQPVAPAAGEYCLLCGVIHLAGNILPSLPSAQPLAVLPLPGPPWTDRSAVLAAVPHGFFQPRAPPLA